MKKVFSGFLLMTFMIAFVSCDKDDVEAKSDVFQCKIDGNEFKVEGILAYGVKFSDSFNAYGIDGDGNTMYLAFDSSLGEGTHSFNSDTFAIYALDSGNSYDSRNSGGSGTATITEKTDTSLKGTFSYTAPVDGGTSSIKVTEGSFNVVFR